MGSGTANLGGSVNVAGTCTFSGGTANVTGAGNITAGLVISGGTLNLNGSGTVTPTSLTVSAGTEAGSQTMQVSGPINWTSGAINGMVQFAGGSISAVNWNGILINSGVLALSGNLYMYGGQLTNLATGSVNVAAGTFMGSQSGSPDVANAGHINVAGPGTTTINVPFFNTGTLNIQSGNLSLGNAYSSTNATLDFGISNAANFGSLTLPGPFALNGTLGVTANGYTGNKGDTFPLITYGSETGIFSTFNLPRDVDWEPSYGPTVFSLTVPSLNAPYVTLQATTQYQVADGFTMLLLGPSGSNYMIQASTGPRLTNWVTLTNFTTADSSYYYTDLTATNDPVRIYRAVMK